MPSFDLKVGLADIDAVIDGREEQLLANIRPAAQAGAQILYDAVKRNAAGLGTKTGNLSASIYQAYATHHVAPGVAAYEISWNPRKAPHGHLVEHGYFQRYTVYLGKDGNWYTDKTRPLPAPRQVPAHPFVRPAMAFFPQAREAMVARLLEGIA